MIARIRGEVLERDLDQVVVDAGGVGYRLFVSLGTLAKVPEPGGRVDLYVHTQVREDAFLLYGFATPEEREAFRKLIAVGGVGPKLARSALSAMSPSDLGLALRTGDVKSLVRIPGVGKRIAQRLVVELKEAYPMFGPEGGAGQALGLPQGNGLPSKTGSKGADLELALAGLGYKPAQIRTALRILDKELEQAGLEDLIRAALEVLQGRRS